MHGFFKFLRIDSLEELLQLGDMPCVRAADGGTILVRVVLHGMKAQGGLNHTNRHLASCPRNIQSAGITMVSRLNEKVLVNYVYT